jgi:hypothetical protein
MPGIDAFPRRRQGDSLWKKLFYRGTPDNEKKPKPLYSRIFQNF